MILRGAFAARDRSRNRMMAEEKRPASEERTYDLLSRAEKDRVITTRYDQYDFTAVLDAARLVRRGGGRLRLVDTGRFSAYELEWLAEGRNGPHTSRRGAASETGREA